MLDKIVPRVMFWVLTSKNFKFLCFDRIQPNPITKPNSESFYCSSTQLYCFFFFQRRTFQKKVVFTPPRNRWGVIFSLQFVCVFLSVCVCIRLIACEQNSSQTDALIWTRFSLNGCLSHWVESYWNWWHWGIKVTGT